MQSTHGEVRSGNVDDPAPIIAREGWPIVAGFALGSLLISGLAAAFLPRLGTLGVVIAGVIGVVVWALTLWCIWFFRDPQRRIPGAHADKLPVISPADGVVCAVLKTPPPTELGISDSEASGMTRVSVFMNVFNVHVNRAPMAGTIEKIHYRPGKFFNASFDKASEHNERTGMVLQLADGRRMVAVQIAGLIARRIVCRVKEGKVLRAGERYGLIRFGSRVDVYLPAGEEPVVKVGDKTVAGETVLGWIRMTPGHGASTGNITTRSGQNFAGSGREAGIGAGH